MQTTKGKNDVGNSKLFNLFINILRPIIWKRIFCLVYTVWLSFLSFDYLILPFYLFFFFLDISFCSLSSRLRSKLNKKTPNILRKPLIQTSCTTYFPDNLSKRAVVATTLKSSHSPPFVKLLFPEASDEVEILILDQSSKNLKTFFFKFGYKVTIAVIFVINL